MKRREFIAAAAAVPAAAAIPALEEVKSVEEPESIATDLHLIIMSDDGQIANLDEFVDLLGDADNALVIAYLPEETPKCVVVEDHYFKHTIHMYWGKMCLEISKTESHSTCTGIE